MKKLKSKVLIVIMVITGLISITATAANSECQHRFIIQGTPYAHYTTTHYVPGDNGAELCTTLHVVDRIYTICDKCQYVISYGDIEKQFHSNIHCK